MKHPVTLIFSVFSCHILLGQIHLICIVTELKETMARVGADLKQRLMESVRSTWNTVYQLAMFHRSDDQALEQEVDKVIQT
jgi:hypothetical protein